MPYTKGNPPDWLKNLPSGAQALGIRVFNSVYAKTHDDNMARMAAWSQIKRKYKKVGEKWTKMETLTIPTCAAKELLMSFAHSLEAPAIKVDGLTDAENSKLDLQILSILEQRHQPDRCMNCDKSPTIEVLWAEGMGHAWFCGPHFEAWKNKTFELNSKVIKYGDDISAQRKINGLASKKWSEEPKMEAKFKLEQVTQQLLLQNPLHWGEEKSYFLLTIKGEHDVTQLFDKNPLESETASIIDQSILTRPFCKLSAVIELDTGALLMQDLRKFEFLGSKLQGHWVLTDQKLEKGANAVEVQISMAADPTSIKFKRHGDLLYFKALALAPGTWTGIDGHTMKYDQAVILEGAPSFPYQRIKSRHKDRDVDVVGFSTGYSIIDGQAWIDGYVFDQEEIKDIEADIASGKPVGISPELRSMTSLDNDGVYVAHTIVAKGFSFVDSPACKTSWVHTFKKLSPDNINN
jgi:hypothetical protein